MTKRPVTRRTATSRPAGRGLIAALLTAVVVLAAAWATLLPVAASAGMMPGPSASAATASGPSAPLATTPAGSETSSPSPGPTTPEMEAPPVPEDVALWFAGEGAEAVEAAAGDLGVELADDESLAVGDPRQVWTWAEEYVAGTSVEPVAEPVDQWVAPVVLQSAQEPQPLGILWASSSDGSGLQVESVAAGAELAAALSAAPPSFSFVYDEGVEGWFASADGEILPITANARTVLQGAVAAEVFQGFLAERLGGVAPTGVPEPDAADPDSLTPLAPISVILVLGAVAAWLLLRQYRRADSRIAADVRAGVTPPSHEGGATAADGAGPDADGAGPDADGGPTDSR